MLMHKYEDLTSALKTQEELQQTQFAWGEERSELRQALRRAEEQPPKTVVNAHSDDLISIMEKRKQELTTQLEGTETALGAARGELRDCHLFHAMLSFNLGSRAS